MENADLRGRVQSVERAMILLEALSDTGGGRLTDIAQHTGMSPSTVHRLLATLERRSFVHFDRATAEWRVGRTMFGVGAAFMRDRNFVGPALPVLRRLRDQTRETVNLGVPDGGDMIIINQVESREINRAIARVGGRTPMTASGMGKAILATYTPDDVGALIAHRGLRRLTPNTLTRRAELEGQFEQIRRVGYAVDNEEHTAGLRCVGAPVFNDQGEVLCAISVSALAARMPADRIPMLGKLLAQTARELTEGLGGQLPA